MPRLRSLTVALVPLSLVLLAACASGRPVRPQQHDVDQYLIVRSELESSRQPSLYDAIRHLRPLWFAREQSTVVYLDDQLIGGLATLRRLPVHLTAEARFLSANEARVRYGHVNGMRAAILVQSLR